MDQHNVAGGTAAVRFVARRVVSVFDWRRCATVPIAGVVVAAIQNEGDERGVQLRLQFLRVRRAGANSRARGENFTSDGNGPICGYGAGERLSGAGFKGQPDV